MMRNSHDPNQKNQDYIVMPSPNRIPNKSSILTKTHQMREGLYNADSLSRTAMTQPNLQEQLSRLRNENNQYRIQFEQLQRHLSGQREGQVSEKSFHLRKMEQQNEMLRSQLQKFKLKDSIDRSKISDGGDSGTPSSYQSKYQKALKQINNLLLTNKQLKLEIEYFKNNTIDKNEFKRMYEQMNNHKNELEVQNERNQLIIKQLQEHNQMYENRLKQYESNHQNQKEVHQNSHHGYINEQHHYQQKNNQKNNNNNYFLNNANNYQQMIQQFKEQENQMNNQIRRLKQSIYRLESQSNEAHMIYQKQNQKRDSQIQQAMLKIRRESQQQIFTLKNQNNNLKQANAYLQRTNQQLMEQLNHYSDKKNQTENEVIVELKQNIEQLKNQVDRLKEMLAAKDKLSQQVTNINRQLINSNRQISSITNQYNSLKNKYQQIKSKQSKQAEDLQKMKKQLELFKQQQSNEIDNKNLITKLISQNQLLKKKNISFQMKSQYEKIIPNEVFNPADLHPLQYKIKQIDINLEIILNNNKKNSILVQAQQLAFIKTFIVELDQKIKIIFNQNLQNKKKLIFDIDRIKKLQQSNINLSQENESLVSRISEFQVLTDKLQKQLQKTLKSNEILTNELNDCTNLKSKIQFQLKQQIVDIRQKFKLEDKYLKQQMNTKILEYQSKLVLSKKNVQKSQKQLENMKLYLTKIQQLSQKVVRLQIQNNSYKIKTQQLQNILKKNTNTHQNDDEYYQQDDIQNNHIKQLYQKLSEKQSIILKLEYTLKQKQLQIEELIYVQNEFVEIVNKKQITIQKLTNKLKDLEEMKQKIFIQKQTNNQYHVKTNKQLESQNNFLKCQLQKFNQIQTNLFNQTLINQQLKANLESVIQKSKQLESQIMRVRTIEHNNIQLQQKNYQLKNKYDYEVTNFSHQKERLEKINKEHQLQIQALTKSINKLKFDHSVEISELQNKFSDYEQQISNKCRNSELNKYRISQLTQQNNMLSSQINSLKNELTKMREFQNKMYQHQRTISNLQMENNSMKYRLQWSVKQSQRYKANLDQIQQTLSKQYLQISEKDRIIRSQQFDTYQIKMKIQEEKYKVFKQYYRMQNNSLKAELDRLQYSLTELNNQNMVSSKNKGISGYETYLFEDIQANKQREQIISNFNKSAFIVEESNVFL